MWSTAHLFLGNDGLIHRSPGDKLSKCSIPQVPSIPLDALTEFVTEETVQRAIFKPSARSSAREDGIPADILRAVWQSPNGRFFLRLIILSSISLSHVPPGWKRAIIHPIPKPKSPKFRPISLLNQIGKVCERIITWFLQAEATIGPNQLGSRADVSAIDAAWPAHHLSSVTAANKRPFPGIFLDIIKAHDLIYTGILSAKPFISHGSYDGSTAGSQTASSPSDPKVTQTLSPRPAMGYHKAPLSVSCSFSSSSTTFL